MRKLFFLIGSSGSGKTTAARAVEKMEFLDLVVCYSDSMPVPSTEEMVKKFGSQEEWQRQNTIAWVKKIREEYLAEKDVLFDIQSRPSFIDEACGACGIRDYEVILFDCSDEERRRRLVEERGQPELAHEDMMNWAKYLRKTCVGKNHVILDNTNFAPERSLRELMRLLGG